MTEDGPIQFEIDFMDGYIEVFWAYQDGYALGMLKDYAVANGYKIRRLGA